MSNAMKLAERHDDMVPLVCGCGCDYVHEVRLPDAVDKPLRDALKFEQKDTVFGGVIAFIGCEWCYRLSALRLDFHKGNTGLVMVPIDWRSFNG